MGLPYLRERRSSPSALPGLVPLLRVQALTRTLQGTALRFASQVALDRRCPAARLLVLSPVPALDGSCGFPLQSAQVLGSKTPSQSTGSRLSPSLPVVGWLTCLGQGWAGLGWGPIPAAGRWALLPSPLSLCLALAGTVVLLLDSGSTVFQLYPDCVGGLCSRCTWPRSPLWGREVNLFRVGEKGGLLSAFLTARVSCSA